MTSDEIRFVALDVIEALRSKRLLGWEKKPSRHLTTHIARVIEDSRLRYKSSDTVRKSVAITDGFALIKKSILEIIPPTFGWWLEADHDVQICVRWLWLGHPAVTHSGSVSDFDITILLALLKNVDWEAEAREAMATVEAAEAALLRSAQERRRLRLSDNAHMLALPSIEILAHVPTPTYSEKKRSKVPKVFPLPRLTSEEITQRLSESKKRILKETEQDNPEEFEGPTADRERQSDEPTESVEAAPVSDTSAVPQKNLAEIPPPGVAEIPKKDRTFPRRGDPGYFLTRAPWSGGPLHSFDWEEFEDLKPLMDAVRANPPGTYTAAHILGAPIKGAQQVWKCFGGGRPYPSSYRGTKELRPLTRREYHRLSSGTPRRRTSDGHNWRTG